MAKQKSNYEDYIFSQVRWKQQIFNYKTSNIVIDKILKKAFNSKILIYPKGFDVADIAWSIKQQSLFIESLMLNIAPHANSIITLKIPEASRQTPDDGCLLIDGLQRILTLQKFRENALPLQRGSLSLLEFTTVFYRDLPDDIKGKLYNHTSLRVVEFECDQHESDFGRIAQMLRDRFSP